MAAWSSLKNNTLFTAILILTFGLYVPKDWRRAAAVGGVLAILPCATLACSRSFSSVGNGVADARLDRPGNHSAAAFDV